VFSLASNPGGLVKTTPLGTVEYGTISTSGNSTTVTINPFMLGAGSYAIEITGTTSATNGGSYTGTLNLTPVPLPGTLLLILPGLAALLALQTLKRRRPAVPVRL